MRHARHAAVGVVGEVRGGAPDRGTCQAVAVRGVGVRAGPRVAVGVVDYGQDVPDAVVSPFAGVVPHGGAVLRAYLCGVVAFGLGFAVRVHGDVLAAGSLYQPVQSVVFKLLARADGASVEEHRLLGVVVNLRDIARGVVGVVEVLQDVRAVVSRGQEPFQAERFLVVGVACRGAVAVLYPLALPLRIVVDIPNKVRGCRGPAQLDIYRFQQRSLVVCGQDLARRDVRVVRGLYARRAVQRVVGGNRRERLRFQQGVRVGDVPVLTEKSQLKQQRF